MFLNSDNMLFCNLSQSDKSELIKIAEDIILYGKVPNPMPSWFGDWFSAGQFRDHDKLMVIATALPQRLLLSVAMDQKRK